MPEVNLTILNLAANYNGRAVELSEAEVGKVVGIVLKALKRATAAELKSLKKRSE